MKIHPLGKLTDEEKKLVQAAVPELATSIETVRSPGCILDCADRLNDLLVSNSLGHLIHPRCRQRGDYSLRLGRGAGGP